MEKLIESIEKTAAADAVAKVMPKAFAAGVAVTAAAAAGLATIIKRASKSAEARKAEANEAKARLASIVDEASTAQNAGSDEERDEGEGPEPAGSEGQP